MTKMKLFFVLIVLSSCTYHMGSLGGGTAVVNGPDFAISGFAYGTSKTVRVMGIGGNKKDALVLEAKKNLYNSFPLQQGQALGNMTVDFKNTIFFPVITTKVTVSAEIIDFNPASRASQNLDSLMNAFASSSSRIETSRQKFGYGRGEFVRFIYEGQEMQGKVIDVKENGIYVSTKDKEGNNKGFLLNENMIILGKQNRQR